MNTQSIILTFCCLTIIHSNKIHKQKQPIAICVKKGVDLTTVETVIDTNSPTFLDMIIESNAWVDKTLLLREVAETKERFFIVTWARRWGKTINLSMIKLYFEMPIPELNQKNGVLGPDDFKKSEAYRFFKEGVVYDRKTQRIMELEEMPLVSCWASIDEHLQKYPVILLDFKSAVDYDGAKDVVRLECYKAFEEHLYLKKYWISMKDDESLDQTTRNKYNSKIREFVVYYDKAQKLEDYSWGLAIQFLTAELKEFHGKGVILLIDEYDSYFNNIYLDSDFAYKESDAIYIIELFKCFYISTFKENNNLHKVILTGITRFAGVSMCTTFREFLCETSLISMQKLAPYYGITTEEFEVFAYKRGFSETMIAKAIERYDGYRTLDDPDLKFIITWNVAKFINTKVVRDYWKATTVSHSIFSLLKYPNFMKEALNLMSGKSCSIPREHMVMLQSRWATELKKLIDSQEQHVVLLKEALVVAFAVLAQLGYLTPTDHRQTVSDHIQLSEQSRIELEIPNGEIKSIFETYVFSEKIRLIELHAPLFFKTSEKFAEHLLDFFTNIDIVSQQASYNESLNRLFHKLYKENGPYMQFIENTKDTALQPFEDVDEDHQGSVHQNEAALAAILTVTGMHLQHTYHFDLEYLRDYTYRIPNYKTSLRRQIDMFVSRADLDVIFEFKSEKNLAIQNVLLQAIHYTSRYGVKPLESGRVVYVALAADGLATELSYSIKTPTEVAQFLKIFETQVINRNESGTESELVRLLRKNSETNAYLEKWITDPLCTELKKLEISPELVAIFKIYNLNGIDELENLTRKTLTDYLLLPDPTVDKILNHFKQKKKTTN